MNMTNPAFVASPKYQEFAFTLAAGAERSIFADCSVIACLEADADFEIGFDGGSKTVFKKGLSYRAGAIIRSIEVLNTSGSTNAITLAIAKGDIRDARLVLSGGLSTTPAGGDFIGGNAVVTATAAANVQVLAENLVRREAGIKNTGTETVWIRTGTATAAAGHPLGAGETLVLSVKTELRAYNASATNCDLAVWEVEN